MNKKYLAALVVALFACSVLIAQKTEPIPYGDMDNWLTRVMRESLLLGGKWQKLYAITSTGRIDGDIPYKRNNKSPWATSDVLASPAGIVKTSVSVFPEKRDNGYCARLEVCEEHCKAIGIVNIVVVAPGSIFLGGMEEPIKSTKNPMSKLDQGIEFDKRPIALQFDYKSRRKKQLYKATGGTKITALEGSDNAEVSLYLLHRWEDKSGNVFAKRIGTAYEKYGHDVPEWVNAHNVPIQYGDITGKQFFKSYMGLIPKTTPYYTKNSKGKIVPVYEVGWGDENDKVTHIMLRFSASDKGPYIGSVGSTFWVDNVKLVY